MRPRLLRSCRRLGRLALVVAVAVVGLWAGLLLGGSVRQDLGPVQAQMTLRLAPAGGTELELEPLGTVRLSTHSGPLELRIRPLAVQVDGARPLVEDPASLRALIPVVDRELRSGLTRLVGQSAGAALAVTAVLGVAVFSRRRLAAAPLLGTVLLLAGTVLAATLTYDPRALQQPQYRGLLVYAPAVVGDAREVLSRFDSYRQQLAGLLANVSKLYDVTSTLANYQAADDTIRVLHVSDLHLNPLGLDFVARVVEQFRVNAVFDTGDIVDWGTPPESATFAALGALPVPYVFIRGNHDSPVTAQAVAALPNAVVLEGEAREVAGLRVFGAGDPRFTPDRSTRRPSPEERALVVEAGERAGLAIRSAPHTIDLALVHDPVAAERLVGSVQLVLAGHLHKRQVAEVGTTRIMTQGSTGGAGLRGLEHDEPRPLECTVLYFDRATRQLRAYDDVTLGGLGQSSVRIDRTVIRPSRGPER